MLSRARTYQLLPAADAAVLFISLCGALLLRYGVEDFTKQFQEHTYPFAIVFLGWLIIFKMHDLYNPYQSLDVRTLATNTLRAIVIGAAGAAILFYFTPFFTITPKKNLLLIGFVAAFTFFIWRYVFSAFIKRYAPLKILLVGDAPGMQDLATFLTAHAEFGMSPEIVAELTEERVMSFAQQPRNYYVVLPESAHTSPEISRSMYALLPSGVQILDFTSFYERLYRKVPVSLISELWFLEHIAEGKKPFFETAKRAMDIVFGFIVGIVALTLTPFIAIAIKLDSKGPIILPNHVRIGKNGKQFRLYKFRSMEDNAEKHGPQWTQKNDPRITRVGKYLRELRLDELPQVFNILKGDLSFVGPRPERPEFVAELKKEIPFYDMRHLVKPGLSGWAQTNPPFYYAGTAETIIKLQYDLYYVKNRNLLLDVTVLLNTLSVLISRLGR